MTSRIVESSTLGRAAEALTRGAAAFATACLLAMSAAGQQPDDFELLAPPLPSSSLEGSGTRDLSGSDTRSVPAPPSPGSSTRGTAVPSPDDATFADDASLGFGHEVDSSHFDINAPALTESSGTWLRRGWWYARTDIVFLQRTWASADLVLATDTTIPPGTPPGVPLALVEGNRALTLENSNPGREEAVRLTLGRFLFRDTSNRDHTAEFTYFGGGEFGQNSILIPVVPGNVGVSVDVAGAASVTFTGANESSINYDSRFNSFEWNYVVTSRLRRDRSELQPNGDWIRRANTGWTYHGLFGLRYFDLTERINWTADGIPATPFTTSDGQYDVRTENDAFGPQLGGGLTYESDRFNITFGGKVGALANNVNSDQALSFTDPALVGFTNGDRDNTLAFLGQFEITGRWHIRPNLSLRAGYEGLLLTAIGLAPNQLDFEPADGRVVVSGDSFYHGISMGLEGYW